MTLFRIGLHFDRRTIGYEDARRVPGRLLDHASDAHIFPLVGVNGLLWAAILRAKGKKEEYRVWFRLIEKEPHRLPMPRQSIPRNLCVYHFSAYGYGLV